MSEKRVIVTLEDGFGRVQTSIATSLSAPQLMDKIMEIDEQQAIIDRLQRYNDVLHKDNLLNNLNMFEFMKEKGVFDEFYERIKKEVLNDE